MLLERIGIDEAGDAFAGAEVEVVAAFSVVTHFDGFQKGVIDSRDLLFFLSVIGFALFATSVILRNHRAG